MNDGKVRNGNTPEVTMTDQPADRTPCPNCPCCYAFVCRDGLWDDWYGDQEPPDPPCPCETAPAPAPTPTEAGERFNAHRVRALAIQARSGFELDVHDANTLATGQLAAEARKGQS